MTRVRELAGKLAGQAPVAMAYILDAVIQVGLVTAWVQGWRKGKEKLTEVAAMTGVPPAAVAQAAAAGVPLPPTPSAPAPAPAHPAQES